MDLLTSDGWSPVYQISAVLLQIRMAMYVRHSLLFVFYADASGICSSNLEPRPARLDQNWQHPYTISEAVAGFQRAAATHGWTGPFLSLTCAILSTERYFFSVPEGVRKLI